MLTAAWLGGAVLVAVALVWLTAFLFLHDVPAGQIRLVHWVQGPHRIYRGPAKSVELPLLANGTTISGKPMVVELGITDQTADAGETPRPIEVRADATAIVSVGGSDTMIRTAASGFCALPDADQARTLADLLSGAMREALSRLRHDALFSTAPGVAEGGPAGVEHPLAVLVRELCAPQLSALGLVLQSFTIRALHSEVAEARRRQSAAEAQAEAAIAAALQARRVREAQLASDRVISDKERELAETRAQNAALIAQATARQQEIKAKADAERVRIEAEAAKEALRGAQFGMALDEALRITKIAAAQAEGFRKVNDSVQEGRDSYFRYRLIEMLPQLTPAIAEALSKASAGAGPATDNGSSRKRNRLPARERTESVAPPEPDVRPPGDYS